MPGDYTVEQASPKGKSSEFRRRGLVGRLLTSGCTVAPIDRTQTKKQCGQLSVDSNIFVRVAPPTLAPGIFPWEKEQKVKAVDADSREFTHYGQRGVTMITSTGVVRILFHIMAVARPILSIHWAQACRKFKHSTPQTLSSERPT